MIAQSKYLPKQMNGPVVCSVMEGMEGRLKNALSIESYLYGLSIATAQETELDSIGKIVGYPRPLVPEGFESENVLILTTLPMEQDTEIGLSETGSEVGGRLASARGSRTDYMDADLYRTFLDKVAYIKRYGVTLYSVDSIAALIDKDYTIEYTEDKDIRVSFAKPIGFKNVWILTSLFYRLATSPQVIIMSGLEGE